MVIWGIMTWWYSDGWRQCFLRTKERLASMLDFFSVELLAKTLLAPFRQISAGGVRGSFDVQVRAFVDQLISRIIGMFVRLIIIVVGSIAVVLSAVFGIIFIIMWPLVPLLPILGVILYVIGWMPWIS